MISGDICVSCIKIHSTGYITFIKLFNFENNNCIHNSKAKYFLTFSAGRLSILSYLKGSAMQQPLMAASRNSNADPETLLHYFKFQ